MKKTKELKRRTRGITLIALVVTIVILLILAGVSINLVLGPNGLISRAQDAAMKTEEAAKEEQTEIDNIDDYIEQASTYQYVFKKSGDDYIFESFKLVN